MNFDVKINPIKNGFNMAAVSLSSSMASVGGLTSVTFFEIEAIVDQCLDQCFPVKDIADLVINYLAPEHFGAAEWLRWFGVNVGREPKLSRKIILFCNQPGVSGNYLPPVLCPQLVDGQPFTLKLLGQIVQNPRIGGHASKYACPTQALNQHQDTPAGPACWLVMKKGVEARGQSYAAQVAWIQNSLASHEATSSALHLATVVFTRHVMTGEYHLGDEDGQEGRWSFGRCQELESNGAEDSCPLVLGGFCHREGLSVFSRTDGVASDGVVALRKF